MTDIFLHILQTPYLFAALGSVTSVALFISPVLYNGDYKTATKSIIIVAIFIFFSMLLNYSHIALLEQGKFSVWIQPILIEMLVAISYVLGLFIGVFIQRRVR
jgi:uncharacterized protein (DUF983 family)